MTIALPPNTTRLDLKCGRGAISQGEKCHKGAATKIPTAAVIGGAVLAAGALALASRRRRPPTGSVPSGTASKGMDFLAEGTRGKVWVSKDRKSVTKVAKDNKAASALFEEARIQRKAKNAGVETPSILEVDRSNKSITMENLQDYKPILSVAKAASTQQKAAYAKSLVVNLSKAHAADIAHGDLNTNVLAKDGKLSIIDWGQASRVRDKGMVDILNVIRIADDLDPALAKAMKQRFKPLQAKFSRREALTVADFNAFYADVLKRKDRSDELRVDLKCGKGAISAGETCHKGGAFPREQAIAAGLGVAALTAGAFMLSRRSPGVRPLRSKPSPSATPPSSGTAPRPSGPPQLPGSPSPYGYLRPGALRKSKTQRMRENTQAAVRGAERAMGKAAQAEITRAGAVANAMASAGEATGMVAKTTLRELRLRTEAARRRFEPGYRRSPAATPKPPAQLPEGLDPSLNIPFNPPRRRAPETAPIDPRTGQPRRRQARGFGRTDNYISLYAPVVLSRIQ